MNKFLKPVFVIVIQMVVVSASYAGDFEWFDNFNIKAEADSSGYRLQLGTRFHIGNAEVNAVIRSVDHYSDAYMILRLGELSGHSTERVLNEYQRSKNKGWGNMAKNLGIMPGSKEFHALKRGDDMRGNGAKSKNKKDKSNKGNGKNKNKGNGKGHK